MLDKLKHGMRQKRMNICLSRNLLLAIYYYSHLLFGHGRHSVTWIDCNTGPNPYWIAGMERQQNLCADTSPYEEEWD